jgi:type II secretion system protein I
LTLLEVLVALAIFFMAWVAIARLVAMASDQALDVRLQTEALQLAQTKMAEVISGVQPLQSQSDTALDPSEAPNQQDGWTWAVDCNPGEITNLWNVQVRVKWTANGRTTQVALTQVILDPSVRGTTQQQSSSSSGSGSSGASGSSSGSTTSP